MRITITTCLLLYSVTCLAIDADFSKSYIIPEKSGTNIISIGGIDAFGNSYLVDFTLQDDLTLAIENAITQESVLEQLEQSLRNTIWTGNYLIGSDDFITNLNLVVVQNGYVGGEITHTHINGKQAGFLNARLTGDIINQFEIDDIFIDEDRIPPEDLEKITEETPNRQLIRIKRMRALEFLTPPSAGVQGWSTNREYRLILDNGALTGSVGVPNDVYGSVDGTSENGSIHLEQQ